MQLTLTPTQLIEAAEAKAGGQTALARLINMQQPSLAQMKKGTRPMNWRVRGKLRAVLGEDPAHAFVASIAEDLAGSENPDERKAAQQFETMLAAFPDEGWRKRSESTAPEPTILHVAARHVVSRFRNAVNRALGSAGADAIASADLLIGHTAG